MTKASFNDIRQQIIKSIQQANKKIIVAVAWFTSKDLLGELTEKLKHGCEVEIIISDHTENRRLSFALFIKEGGKVHIIKSRGGKFLHEKFCVFDNQSIIVGSYNWTNSAEFYNHEFIIQSSDDLLVKQFSSRFEILKNIVTKYDRQLLSANEELTAETKEEDFIILEDELAHDFLNTVIEANSLGAKIGEKIVENYIFSYGAVGAATRLINAGPEILHSGLIKLFEINRLDLSFESIIQREKYSRLFDKLTLKKASQRLEIFSK